MKVLDLFSGIGGFSLGLERAGMETVAFCEIKEYPRKVLRKHWPQIPCYEDIKKLNKLRLEYDGIEKIEVVCGGFPCQDLSSAGKQAGTSGKKSGLYREMLRIISELRPKYAIFENVSNLIIGDSGRWFAQFLYDLASVGYDAEWHCISASAIGANHHRDRVWVIAYPKGDAKQNSIFKGVERDIFFKSKSGGGSWEPISGTHWSETKPGPTQMDDGVSPWVGPVSGYGNSVVPAIPELIGRAILKYEISKIDRESGRK